MPSRASRKSDPAAGPVPAGVVGLGLMGTSICACLLASGHPVIGIETNAARRRGAAGRVRRLLAEMQREGLLREPAESAIGRLKIHGDNSALAPAAVVVEAVFENVEIKRGLIAGVEAVVSPRALIGTNTSAIPVSELQRDARHPGRILGLHWAEPAHVTRFMEVICGKSTSAATARQAMRLARGWGKEPSLLRRDIRGFITNRCFYALLREAFHLVDAGYATVADVDRSLRNDLGWWITFAGPFRFMDITGIPAYGAVCKDLFPELDNSPEVPASMRRQLRRGARGTANAKGFYRYTPQQARRWEELFLRFSYDVRKLAMEYPEDIGDR